MLWFVLALVLVLLAAAGYWLYQRGKLAAGSELVQLQQQRDEHEQRIRKQQREILAMREQIAVLQRSSEIDRLATLNVRDDFAALEDTLAQTRRELARDLDSFAIHHFEGSWLGWRARLANLRRAFGQWCWQRTGS